MRHRPIEFSEDFSGARIVCSCGWCSTKRWRWADDAWDEYDTHTTMKDGNR